MQENGKVSIPCIRICISFLNVWTSENANSSEQHKSVLVNQAILYHLYYYEYHKRPCIMHAHV